MIDNAPRLVKGFCSSDTLNKKTSELVSHRSPRLLCSGSDAVPRSRSFRFLARSSDGNESRSVQLFEANLWSLNFPPSLSASLVLSTRLMASSSLLHDNSHRQRRNYCL